MKKLTLMLVLIAISFSLISQTPQAFKYQAVVRDNAGNVLVTTNVTFRISILQGSAGGILLFSETHNENTNEFGLVNLEIGEGEPETGSFIEIDWGNGPYFLQVEMDENGGESYQLMGTSQLLSVPYSLYSESTGDTSRWRKSNNDLYFNNGSVGIGTDNPNSWSKLNVKGNFSVDGNAYINHLDATESVLDLFNTISDWELVAASDNNRFDIRKWGGVPALSITDNNNIGIGTESPDESALLELNSNSKGFLPPRLTNAERDAIVNPIAGLFIYNIDENIFQTFNGLFWQSLNMLSCVPAQPGSISGTAHPGCNQAGMIYSIDEIVGATNYNWTVPSDATIVGGSGTTSIIVDFGTQSGNVSVRAENGCGNSAYTDLIITIGIPSLPGSITGNAYPECNETGAVYSIDTVPGALNYLWVVPADATITGGQGTTSVTVDFGTQSGNVSVRAENLCGNSDYTDLEILIGIPFTPDTISGNTYPECSEEGVSYSTDSVPGATNYTWTVPANATIASGQGTPGIEVDYYSPTSGNVSVRAENSCGNSPYADLAVNVGVPSTPGSITGDTDVPTNVPGIIYSIDPVPGATSYIWTVPEGATFTQQKTRIIVDFGTQSGQVTVRALNSCGSSNVRELHVEVTFEYGSYYEGGILFHKEILHDYLGTGHWDTIFLVCAETDQSIGTEWGCYGTGIPDAEWWEVLYGDTNTLAIVNECAENGIAARICDDLILNGYDDWFLPAIFELESMYIYLHQAGFGNFVTDPIHTYYWSSTQECDIEARGFGFSGGQNIVSSKLDSYRVRAVRKIVHGGGFVKGK